VIDSPFSRVSAALTFAVSTSLGLGACGGAENAGVPADAGDDAPPDGTLTPSDGGAEAAAPAEGGLDASSDAPADGSPPYLLLSYGASSAAQSELAVFSVPQGETVAVLPGIQQARNTIGAASPWAFDPQRELVLKMSAVQPWIVESSWSISADGRDGGPYAGPDWISVAETGSGKAYVTRYSSNRMYVLDLGAVSDGGAPSTTIDLSSFLQAGDTDGLVDVAAAFYVASYDRVFVVLGNVDRNDVDPSGLPRCKTGLFSAIGMVQGATATVIPNPHQLFGMNPQTLVYDSTDFALVVSSAGCSVIEDGGIAPVGREISQMFLGNLLVTTLVDATSLGFPGSLVWIDGSDGFAEFGGVTYGWNPGVALGAVVPNAPDVFVWDGNGSLVGPRTTRASDGGVTGTDVLRVNPASGVTTVIGSNPISQPDPAGSWRGVDMWPHP
jgi:hypothetical protein